MKQYDSKKFTVFCLMIFGRSGSKFFQGILDWHPQIISFPRNLHFNSFWQKVERRKDDVAYVVDTFIEDHPRAFSGALWYLFNKYDRADELGTKRDETFSVDMNAFRRNALELLQGKEMNRREAFVGLHLAYHAASGRELADNSIIFCHIHAIRHIDELRAVAEDFPDTRVLIRTRHPIERLKSCAAWMKMQNVYSCGQPYEEEIEDLEGTEPIRVLFPALDMRVLTFEQLHWHHREAMEAFVRWVGIEWNESLMVSTIHGKLWWGDSKVLRHGSNPKWRLYKPKGFLEKKDWRVLLALNGERLKQYGYASAEEVRMARLGRLTLLGALLLPTKYEWTTLKTMFSLSHWWTAVRTIIDDTTSERRRGFDFYTKKRVKHRDEVLLGIPVSGIAAGYRVARQLVRHIWLLNPLKWVWFCMKRVVMYWQYAEGHRKRREILLPLLLEKTAPPAAGSAPCENRTGDLTRDVQRLLSGRT